MIQARKQCFLARNITSKRFATTYNTEKMLKKYPIGKEIHGFEIEKVLPIPELSFTAVNLKHNATGLDYLHIDRADKNNVFSIVFKTNPTDSTGLPHILEHTTLCGSEKFPVRDPFFKMLNRSLANFMNAMTGHDYTFYPFATTNVRDYENLRDIYFDACFNPALSNQDFCQEGWRLENEITQDKLSPIIFKGVVYNEMKGQFSDSSYHFYINFINSIYPSLFISGGDPKEITNLTHEDLLDFHASRYHPSNAKVFSYGNIPISNNLKFLNNSLTHFGKRGLSKKDSKLRQPIDLTESKTVTLDGPVDPTLPESQQYKASMTWFVGKPNDRQKTFQFLLLSNLLMSGHSSPFYKKLIGIGNDFSVNSGSSTITDLTSFTIGLNGLSEEKIQLFENTVNEVLLEKAKFGFEEQKVEALLRQIELTKKDKKSDFGLQLLESVVPNWVNEIDPFKVLAFDEIIEEFKKEYKDSNGKLFQNLIKEYLLGKPIFKFIMKPNEKFTECVLQEEAQRLSKKTNNLSDEDKETIFQNGLKLAEEQSKKEDLSILPTLTVDFDIPTEATVYRVEEKHLNDLGFDVLTRKTDTNGLMYFRCKKEITGMIPARLLPYLPLFCDSLLSLGTKNKSVDQLEDEIKLYTGGLNTHVYVKPDIVNNNKSPNLFWEISGTSLNSQIDKIYSIWNEILENVDFDNLNKLKLLIKTANANSFSDLISSGHSYARSFACAGLSPVKELDECLGGVSQLKFMNKLDSKIQHDNDDAFLSNEIVPKLKELKSILLGKVTPNQENLLNNVMFGLVGDGEGLSTAESYMDKFAINGKHANEVQPLKYDSEDYLRELRQAVDNDKLKFFGSDGESQKNALIALPSQVAYSGLGIYGGDYLSKDGASLQVLAELLSFKYLHTEIREKGGAYGGGARYSSIDGMFSYYTYRDPNVLRSLEYIENESASQVLKGEITESNINEAKLRIFQSLDAPMDVSSEGMMYFSNGINNEMLQTRRENLLSVELEDIKNVCEKYLLDSFKNGEYKAVAVGPKLEEYSEKNWQFVEF